MSIIDKGSPLLRLLVSAVFAAMATGAWAESCDSPSAVALPFVLNGEGEFCRVTSGTISDFNSWEMQLVEINGVPFTNRYWNTWSGKLPEKIDGKYTIRYVGKHPWSHFELNGNGGSNNDNTNGNPGVPQGLSVTLAAVGSDGKIDLSWAVSGDIKSIQVMRDTDADPTGRQRIAILNSKARSFIDTSVVKGQQYWYWIKYTDATGKAGNSNAGNASAGGNVPTVTPTPRPTPTPVPTAMPTPRPTPTPTPVPTATPTPRPTPTPTPVPTATPTPRPTATPTPVPTSVPTPMPTPIRVTGVTVTPSATMKVGATASLSASVQPANAGIKGVTWSSSNPAVASVSASGVVTGVAKGNASITVTTADGNRMASSAITVTEDQSINFTIQVAISGNGKTDLSAGSHTYKSGSAVTISATPDAGYEFAGWSGAFTGNTNPLTITMDGNKTLTAMFTKAGGGNPPSARADNPYLGADRYIDPEWSAVARDSANRATADLKAGIAQVAQQPTSVWLDRIAAIDGSATSMGLAAHLDAALAQRAAKGTGKPMLIEIVVYDLPDRDCHALASNGELKVADNGMLRYKTEYIDRIVEIMQSKLAYQDLRIVTVVEPDSLPNAVTNSGMAACANAAPAYKEGVAYAINRLAAVNNVYIYLDMAHSGWLGWDWGDKAAQLYKEVMVAAGGENLVRGFASNVANYSALKEPFNPYDNLNQYQTLIQNWYEWNRMIDEETYVNGMRGRFPNHHFLIDTSRNGWKAQPAGVPIEARVHRGNWCNTKNAGIGQRPSVEPMAGVDAFVWIKPPGASDGTSDSTQITPDAEGKRFDPMCGANPVVREKGVAIGTDAMGGAPSAGKWFEEQFFMLVRNATPVLDGGGVLPPPPPPPSVPLPTTPSGLSATLANSVVTLTWSDKSSNEQGFRIERRLSGAANWTILTNTVANVQSYADATVAAGSSYEYRVSAFNATGSSATLTASVMVPKPVEPVPTAPSGLKATVGTSAITLSWTDNSNNETGFRIERRVSGDASWMVLTNTTVNVLTYTDSAAVPGTTYDYRVASYNVSGASAAITASAMVTPSVMLPSAPSAVTTKVIDNGSVNLAWADNSNNETGFRIERRVSGDSTWVALANTAANVQTYSDATVAMGKAYEYRVYANNSAGSSAAATGSATLLTLAQYGEQQYKDTAVQRCAACHGADGNGAFPLAARTASDFAALTKVIADTMPNAKGLCVNNCAKGTAAYIIKMQTGVSIDANGNSGSSPPVSQACKGGELFCEDFESFTSSTATSTAWTIENDNPGNASVSIDGTHARGTKALHLSTIDNGMAFLVPTKFSPPGNSFFGRMWIWVDAFPTKPDYAHFTMVEASGADSGTKVRAIGGQYIPGQGNGSALWGVGSDGGPTGDWTSWQTTTPTAGGKWTCMEWQMDATDNAVNVWIDGVAKPELSVSTKKHGNGNSDFIFPTFNKIRFGWQLYQGGATPPKYNIWLDDISLTTTRVGCGA